MSLEDTRRPLFNGTNQPFRLWKLRVKGLLRAKSCLSAIEEDVSKPPEDTPSTSLENAAKLNEIAVVVILDTLDDCLAEKLCNLSAYKIWKAMEHMFNTETTSSLITKLCALLLHSMSSNQDNPVEYWTSSMTK
ncbi:hypothetical protein IW150_003109 [Coemansia sp. RSA 2607]|nr:hypothetical protein IW150_003109 [Coemansia sp. RSA 2607]KAJ2397049.1 hypothetical protein GGI05_000834 [Coemansia sp. RSA 2603]